MLRLVFTLALGLALDCHATTPTPVPIGKIVESLGNWSSGVCNTNVRSIHYYVMDGLCKMMQGPNDANRRRRRAEMNNGVDTSRRRREGKSYKATAGKIELWEQTESHNGTHTVFVPGSATCAGAPKMTYNANACNQGMNRRRSNVGSSPPFFELERSTYIPNVQPGDELFTYKAYSEPGTCNLAGNPPPAGKNMYQWGAARGGCKVRTEGRRDCQSGQCTNTLSYNVEEWSSGSAPNVEGPFVKVSIWTNVSGAADNCSVAKPDSIAYYPGSPSGTCIRTGSDTSIKVTTGANGKITAYGRRRRSSTDCSSAPTGEVAAGSGSFSPPPPPPTETFEVEFGMTNSSATPGPTTGWYGAISPAGFKASFDSAVWVQGYLTMMQLWPKPGDLTISATLKDPPQNSCGEAHNTFRVKFSLAWPQSASSTIKPKIQARGEQGSYNNQLLTDVNATKYALGKQSVPVPGSLCGPSETRCQPTCCSCGSESVSPPIKTVAPAQTCVQDMFSVAIEGDGEGQQRSVKIDWAATGVQVAANMWINSQWSSPTITPKSGANGPWDRSVTWPANRSPRWACSQAALAKRKFVLYDSSKCVYDRYLVNPPPQTSKIEQKFTYSHLNVNTYAGDVKATYETGYGLAIGIYTDTGGYKQGCSVLSKATAARRAGIDVSYTAVVTEAEVQQAKTAAAAVTDVVMSSKIAEASTALGTTSVAAPTAAQTTVKTQPKTVKNASPTSSVIVGGPGVGTNPYGSTSHGAVTTSLNILATVVAIAATFVMLFK